jgi:hypothetical protein
MRRSARKMARVRSGKKRMSVLKLFGFGLGTYLGLTYTDTSNPGAIIQDPQQGMMNLFTSITGVGFPGGHPTWNIQNLGPFWVPVITFSALDWVGKKLLHHNVKLTKDLSLF